ncbi:MAG: glutathione S-transferase family protein [Leptolyngbyaceae cyanobacterium SM1_1_3]|nr:glutathione S-transferase family protein [Leptolyngbyaceae cyanobacterium SM1_1_3]NJN01012.1 glutathione S-transferase family protein [Leptolyngbyaceae cyanobacterium RM1_1_2]
MLTLYYHPLSPISRRVWIALLEKAIPFEPVVVNLTGEQLKPEFLALNPFHHVPVVVDGSLRILESLAILDYLEARYPATALMPQNPAAIAQVRMVQMVTVNELTTKLPALVLASDTSTPDKSPDEIPDKTPDKTLNDPVSQQVSTILSFLNEQLGELAFFGGEGLSLADITVGTALPLMQRLGVKWLEYAAIAAWFERVVSRSSWQQTELNDVAFATWKRWVLLMIKQRQRQMART